MSIWASFKRKGCVRGKQGQFYMHSIELSFVEDFFFCSFIKWDKRSYEEIYDSVKVGTAENQAGMP